MLFFQRKFGLANLFKQRRIVFAQLFLRPQFLEMHVQLENFFQKIGGNNLLLQIA